MGLRSFTYATVALIVGGSTLADGAEIKVIDYNHLGHEA